MMFHKYTKISLLGLLLSLVVSPTSSGKEITIDPSGELQIKKSATSAKSGFLLKFDLPEFLSNSVVQLAELRLYLDIDSTTAGSVSLLVSPSSDEWNTSSIAAIKLAPTYSDTGLIFKRIKVGTRKFCELNVTETVTAWSSNKIENRGFYIRIDGTSDKQLLHSSRQWGVKAKLVIRYTNKP